MSLIAGYLSRKGKHETAIVEKKVKSYNILSYEDPGDYENVVIETKFGHIIQKYKRDYPIQSKPCRDINGNLLVTFGFLYPLESITSRKKLLELCVGNSSQILEECEGEFVSIVAEGHSGTVHIINDRFASRSFYVLQTNDGVYFSSNLAFLLYFVGGKQETDVLGWLQIFSYGRTLETRTTFRDIKRIRPGTHVTITSDGMQEKQYWRLEYKPETDLNPVTHSEEVFKTFQAGTALRAKLVGEGIVAISGGLDSRLVASTLCPNARFSAFTFVDSLTTLNTAEVMAAAEVSKILKLEHHIEPTREMKVSEIANDIIMLTGGLRPLQHMAKCMLYIYELKRLGLNFMLGGGPGDVMAGSIIPSIDYLDPDKTKECIRLYCDNRALGGENSKSVLALLIRDNIVHEYFPLINISLSKLFEKINGPTAAHRVTAWVMMNSLPASTFTSPIHNHPDITEAFSHLNYKYCELMLKLPAEWLYQRNFYSFMIYHCFPQLRHVIYGNTGKLLSGRMLHFNHRYSRLRQMIFRRKSFGKKLIKRLIYRVPSYPFHYALLQNDDKLFLEIADTIHSNPLLKEILDDKKCMQFLNKFKAGRIQTQSFSQDAELMGSLATMCFSFKKFNS